MLDQIYITGGHLGGGGGAGNGGSDEGQWRRRAEVAGWQVVASATTAAAGVALEERRRSAGALALAACYYLPALVKKPGFKAVRLVLTAYKNLFSCFFVFVIRRFCTSKPSFGYVFLDLARCVFVGVFVRD